MDLVQFVQDEFVGKKDLPEFAAGDTITVYYKITEGEKTRTQFFRGVVLQRRGSGVTETFTIRKMSGNVGVERIFPVNLPAIEKIEINKKGKVRRARIFYQRELTGKAARIKERRLLDSTTEHIEIPNCSCSWGFFLAPPSFYNAVTTKTVLLFWDLPTSESFAGHWSDFRRNRRVLMRFALTPRSMMVSATRFARRLRQIQIFRLASPTLSVCPCI